MFAQIRGLTIIWDAKIYFFVSVWRNCEEVEEDPLLISPLQRRRERRQRSKNERYYDWSFQYFEKDWFIIAITIDPSNIFVLELLNLIQILWHLLFFYLEYIWYHFIKNILEQPNFIEIFQVLWTATKNFHDNNMILSSELYDTSKLYI